LPENVVVTGGADSVGRVIAERFLARGDRVHICDVRPEALAEALAANPGMTGTLADVGDHEAVACVFRDAAAAMGDVAVLINNVGIAGPRAAIEDITREDWEESLRVNLSGMFFACSAPFPS
jgi:NAD(P)-dependent dehydrogenase (short-subunit alcohol dehydrogenase family)